MTSVGSYAFDLLAARPSKFYSGPAHDAPADEDTIEAYKGIKVLVLGAGGVGCEVLHNLAMTGITDIHVIDMDTVDLTNLNRQFLFRQSDIGQFKAEAAANFIMRRFPHVKVSFSNDRVEKNAAGFFREFNFVLLAVDTVPARKWVNNMLASLILWHPEAGEAAASSSTSVDKAYPTFTYRADEGQGAIPIIDVGSEGYMCTAKTIIHGESECMCLAHFPETKTVQVCTLESTPRRPEHCVTFVTMKLWETAKPFGTIINAKGVEVPSPVDGDNEAHIAWIAQRAQERLEQFKLPGSIDFTFTQGVVKNSIPAVGFTNATVAAVMVGEMFKHLLHWGKPAPHYGLYSGSNRVCSNRTDLAWSPSCESCVPARHIDLSFDANIADILKALMAHPQFIKLAKGRSTAKRCIVNMKKYMDERPLFSLKARSSASGAEDDDNDTAVAVAESDSFFAALDDLVKELEAAMVVTAAGGDASASSPSVNIRAKQAKVREVFGLRNQDDAEVASLYIVVFDTVKFLINWSF